MKQWPHVVLSYTSHEVQVYAVQNQEWQINRIRMKGLTTEQKLDFLQELRSSKLLKVATTNTGDPIMSLHRPWQVAIDNYLNALKRGGLLNDRLEVVK